MVIEYTFPGASIVEKTVNNKTYKLLFVKDFSKLHAVGKPALPAHNDIIAIPVGADAKIKYIELEYRELNNYLIYPSLKPATDTYGDSEPEFEIEFTGGTSFFIEKNHSENSLKMLPNHFLNSKSIRKEVNKAISYKKFSSTGAKSTSLIPNYIIITHSNYEAAADSLAEWKSQLGYCVEIISKSNWSSADVKSEIQARYQNYTPKPDYFVIIGDHTEVPGEVITSNGSTFATDLYYACMDGPNDYVADMARGRISVISANQAMVVVKKIIKYEKKPVSDTSFYSTATHAAYFQHAGNGYAERRFAQTSEDARNYMTSSIGKTINRVYVCGNTVTPTNWNNGFYSAGEPLPSYLLKPGFAWDGDYVDIKNEINAGRFYALHRDHGSVSLWGDPYFTSTHIGQLTNGSKLPVVFSINCLTGKFLEPECFSEKFLRKTDGGAVGVFCHVEVSYSGYNDGLALGCFDAIWASPGLIPNFTGSGGVNNPNLSAHSSIYTMGDVVNQSLTRMLETWGASQYTRELFHYFGDPAMRMWTNAPIPITAAHLDTIQCRNDSTLNISNSTCLDGLATLVVDGELVGKIQLVNGNGTIIFTPVAGNSAYVTISKHNFKPYVASVYIAGGCPKSRFISDKGGTCLGDSILFTNSSSGTITNYLWDFGSGAIPATANTSGPHYVTYTTSGNKTVTLTVTGPGGSNVYSRSYNIEQYCRHLIPATGTITIDACPGKLYDNGGTSNYTNNTNGVATIAPVGVSNITLNFSSFSFESGYDYLYIYDGPNTNSTLIGQYDGSTFPNGGIIVSSGGSITLKQSTDVGLTESGFELVWTCSYPNTAPAPNFIVSDTFTCNGNIDFTDKSLNGPTSWIWDFGDGNTSTQQNPTHIFSTNGYFTVKLIVSNAFGTDSVIKTNIVHNNRPNPPNITEGSRCYPGQVLLSANASGLVSWYTNPIGGTPIDTGTVFNTPVLSVSTTYYVEAEIHAPVQKAGKLNNSGGGSYFTANNSHYLVFDCNTPIVLESVKVYAGNAATRTIELRNSSGTVIQSKTIFIPNGESRITLDFSIPVGNDLRLAGPVSPNLYRNNNGVSYPYTLANVLEIKYSSASSNPTGYYYYFYDWDVRGPSCASNRVPVTAHVFLQPPITGFTFTKNDPTIIFNDTSVDAMTYFWDFDDGITSTQKNPTHTYTSNGFFNVKLVTSNDCGNDSIIIPVSIDAVPIGEIITMSDINIYPNPTNDILNISFKSNNAQRVVFNLLDIIGRKVWSKEYKLNESGYLKTINLNKLGNGVYMLHINTESGTLVRKIVKY